MSKKELNGFEVYTIACDAGTSMSFVPEKGAVASSLVMPFKSEKKEVLFLHEYFWDKSDMRLPGGFPFIFPICARLERMGKAGDYLYDSHLYNMPIHGFSTIMPWEVVDCSSDTIILELRESEETLSMYPFHFKVRLIYQVLDKKVVCRQLYTNTDEKDMPYYAGFHPYFLMPSVEEKEKVILNFSPVRRFKYNDRLTDVIGAQDLFSLPVAISNPEINEQLMEVREDNVINLKFPDGFSLHMREVKLQNKRLFSHLQLYTIFDEPFVCVEPWMSFPNALNSVKGVRWLSPGESEEALIELYCD